jgi:drug/metabolite transporter (DMT)-like permease
MRHATVTGNEFAAAGHARTVAVERPVWLYAAGAAVAMAIVGSSFAVLDTLRTYPQSGGQAVRYLAGAGLLVLFAGRRLPRPTARQAVRLALLAGSGLAAFNLLVLAAEASMDPGSVGVIVAAVPVLLALAGPHQAGRRPERGVVAAAVMVAAGAAAVQGAAGERAGGRRTAGNRRSDRRTAGGGGAGRRGNRGGPCRATCTTFAAGVLAALARSVR